MTKRHIFLLNYSEVPLYPYTKMITMKIIIMLLILSVVFSCNQHQVDKKAEGEKLMQLSREWSKSAATPDLEKTLNYWAEDAVVMAPGQPTLKGRNAIRGMLQASSKIPGFQISWEPLSVELSASGDLAYMTEHNQVTVTDSLGQPITEHNKVVTIWKKQADGSWKNVVDIWNAVPAK